MSKPFLVTFEGRSFDITAFLGNHPGGRDVLLEYENKPIDDPMKDYCHSDHAYALLEEYALDSSTKKKVWSGHYVDYSKPIIPQVLKMEAPAYWKWILSRPTVNDVILFPNSIIEALSYCPWWVALVLWVPVILVFFSYGVQAVGVVSSLVCFVFGALTWTFMEYMLHRFVFHHQPAGTPGIMLHFFLHGIHHLIPNVGSRLIFPPAFSIPLAILFHNIFKVSFTALGLRGDNAFMAGFLIAYVAYDVLHYMFHHNESMGGAFGFLKTYHLEHHYKNEHSNYGVSSPLWDVVFGTFRRNYHKKKL